jgi:thiamine pyrophosphate-dependent acetolactate synthase large subunit-like protein
MGDGMPGETLTDPAGRLLRRPLVARLLAARGAALVVSGLGGPTYDVAAAGDQAGNVYLWGAMGLAAMSGLGVAMARPDRRVLVVTGDGEMMMGIGSLATIAAVAPRNLAILVLDNKSFGETGRQAGLTAGPADIVEMGRGAGIAATHRIRSAADIDAGVELLFHAEGPALCVAEVALSDDPVTYPSLDGAFLSTRFREALGPGPADS